MGAQVVRGTKCGVYNYVTEREREREREREKRMLGLRKIKNCKMYTTLKFEFTTLDFHLKKILEVKFSSIWVNFFNGMELEFTKLEFHVFFFFLI